MHKRGFTLIELLVVIAIIGLLATIITASLTSSRAKGRDARRVSDIKTIQLALEQYYNDNYKYPATLSGLVPNYLAVLPTDPLNSAQYKYSTFSSSGTQVCNSSNPPVKYHLGALMESINNGALTQDVDATYNSAYCNGSSPDFSGTSADCSSTAGTAQPGGTELCYDWTN